MKTLFILLVAVIGLTVLAVTVVGKSKTKINPSLMENKALEREFLTIVNLERQALDLSPLFYHDYISTIARNYSQTLIAIAAQGEAKFYELKHLGYHERFDTVRSLMNNKYLEIAENSGFATPYKSRKKQFKNYRGGLFSENIFKLFNEFLNSPSHKTNLLNPKYNNTGIGIVVYKNTIFITQIFAE